MAAKTVAVTNHGAWSASHAYVLADTVTNDTLKVYKCITAGTSAGSGGPTGTGADITDGGAHWEYKETVGAGYTTLNAALSGESANLVTGTCLLTINKYSFEDTTDANTGAGYTVNSSYYIKITSPTSERHAGIWNTGKSRHKKTGGGTWAVMISVQAAYTVVEWQQFEINTPDGSVIAVGIAVTYCKFCNNIVRGVGLTTDMTFEVDAIVVYAGYAQNTVIYRNIIYDFTTYSSNPSFGAIASSSYGTDATGICFLNNTVFNCAVGLSYHSTLTVTGCIEKNNYCGGAQYQDFYTSGPAVTTAKNISSDATSPDGASYRGKTAYSSYFLDYANRDFHLKSTDTVLKDAGDNLGSPYDIDIDGVAVTGTWDIGADEYVAAGAIIEQEGFRFRNDDGSESAATWKANQDTNITLAADTAFRLRFLLKATGNPDSIDAQAEARVKPSGGAFGAWEKIN